MRLRELLRDGVADIQYYMQCNEGGGKGASAPSPIYTPPAAAPATEAATQTTATTPEEEKAMQRDALRAGAKSLQIPISGGDSTGTVGTAV